MMDSVCISQQANSSECTRVYNETPTGENNCVNLEYQAANVFAPDSLIVRLDGIVLDPNQYIIDTNNRTFTLVIDQTSSDALHTPLDSTESLKIEYNKSQNSDSTCITQLP